MKAFSNVWGCNDRTTATFGILFKGEKAARKSKKPWRIHPTLLLNLKTAIASSWQRKSQGTTWVRHVEWSHSARYSKLRLSNGSFDWHALSALLDYIWSLRKHLFMSCCLCQKARFRSAFRIEKNPGINVEWGYFVLHKIIVKIGNNGYFLITIRTLRFSLIHCQCPS